MKHKPNYPVYFAKGTGLEGMTAQTLAKELDININTLHNALDSLIKKGLVRVIRPEDKQ